MIWQDRLAAGDVVVLDGGTGSELQRRGIAMDDDAWSATALLTHPQIVSDVHLDYIRAGAHVIVTNTFATARYVLDAAGLGAHTEALNRRGVELAMRARDRWGLAVDIAGSLSNLPPAMNPDAYPSPNAEFDALVEQAQLLADAGVDFIALEMMQDADHAMRAITAARETGLGFWLGVSCRRLAGRLVGFDLPANGFEQTLDALVSTGPSAINIMHSEVDAVAEAVSAVRQRFAGPIGVYPEIGDLGTRPDVVLSPQDYAARALDWVSLGATMIGGCCGTSPAHIRAVVDTLGARAAR